MNNFLAFKELSSLHAMKPDLAVSLRFISRFAFSKRSFRNTIRVSIVFFYLDKYWMLPVPILSLSVCKGLVDDKSHH